MSQDLAQILDRLRLSEYLPTLNSNGFDTWPNLCVITEDDLAHLGFKLGHRRILQREIASTRGRQASSAPAHGSRRMSPLDQNAGPNGSTSPPKKGEKRRYRRHPRPDANAPKKPKTAYVNFADHLRTDPEISALSFVEIAREVGRQWQLLDPERKREWERAAARALQEHEARMDEYKTTENHRKYRDYLAGFWQDQGGKKRVKPDGASASDGDTASNWKVASWMLRTSEDSSGDPSKPRSWSESQEADAALALAMQRLTNVKDEGDTSAMPSYDIVSLPPEAPIAHAVRSFILGTGSLFYFLTPEHAEHMLHQVYNSNSADLVTVITTFIMAATGAYYDSDCMPAAEQEGLYTSAARLISTDLFKAEQLETMRLMLLFSLYSVLEKHMNARDFVAAGLSIARTKYGMLEDDLANYPGTDDFRKVLRTLVFMDCWLSSSLGYPSIATVEDIYNAQVPPEADSSMNDLIFAQASKIGFISRDIAETMRTSPTPIAHGHVDILVKKVDTWYQELPTMMQLSTLNNTSESLKISRPQKRAVLMVHVLYLGAVVALYRQLVVKGVNSLDQTSEAEVGVTDSDAQNYRMRLSVAAHQMARILGLIAFDGTVTKRCWIMIYWAFNACAVLLFSVTQTFLGKGWSNVDEDLAYAKCCIDVLLPCSSEEPVAARCLEALQPIFDAVQECRNASAPSSKLDPYTLLAASSITAPLAQSSFNCPSPNLVQKSNDPRIIEASERLDELLSDPFRLGMQVHKHEGARHIPGADGCSVFWWQT